MAALAYVGGVGVGEATSRSSSDGPTSRTSHICSSCFCRKPTLAFSILVWALLTSKGTHI